MRWYDYIVCVWFADLIAGGLFSGNLIVLSAGLFGYDIYEGFRKNSVTK